MIKKLILKLIFYFVLILMVLEGLVRLFHLAKDTPTRYLDDSKVEKWQPNQNGFAVTGNRRQNFSEYRINDFGFNSYREFKPTKDKIEIALVGDSFIEGFHQEFRNSIGKKIERQLPGVEVYEYGYAGYDLADQLHLVSQYKDHFKLVDHVILGLKFENDLTRSKYEIEGYRLKMNQGWYKILKNSKLLIYTKSIGALDPVKNFIDKILGKGVNEGKKRKLNEEQIALRNEKYIQNFEALVDLYGYEKTKFILLLDETITPDIFLDYLNNNGFNYIPIGEDLSKSKRATTLIYDMHWNNKGREIVADLIVKRLEDVVLFTKKSNSF